MLPEVGQRTQALMGNTPDSLCKWADAELQINQEGKPGDFCGDLMLHHVSPARRTGWEQSNQHLIYCKTSKWVVEATRISSQTCYIIMLHHHVTSSHINEEETSHSRAVCFVQPPMPACVRYYNVYNYMSCIFIIIHLWYMRTCDSGRYVIPGYTRYCQVAPAGPRRASPTKSAGSDPDLAVFVCSPRSARTAGAKNDQLTAKWRPPSHPRNPCGEWART